jgi:hypothetical protein
MSAGRVVEGLDVIADVRPCEFVSFPRTDTVENRLSGDTTDVMRKWRFTESQIVAILKEGEAGAGSGELTR